MLARLHARRPLPAPLLHRSGRLVAFVLALLLVLPVTAAPGGAALVKEFNTTPYQPGFSSPYGSIITMYGTSITSYIPFMIVDVNGQLFFTAWDSANGIELWTSDGTEAGTRLVVDLNPGAGSSEIKELTAFHGTLFFVVNNGSAQQLWRSDGTPEGTLRITNPELESVALQFNELTDVAGTLFFQVDAGNSWELWKSDGTEAGTVRVKGDFPSPCYPSVYPSCSLPPNLAGLTAIGERLFFSAADISNGRELWASDGTAEGTRLVKDIRPGAPGAAPSEFTDVAGVLFFEADDGSTGRELWRSDGTGDGTWLVKDIVPGSAAAELQELTGVNGVLFFHTMYTDRSTKLWRSDGTAEGTFVVKELNPSNLTNLNGTLLFSVSYPGGVELWTSDGTPAGTTLVKDLGSGSASNFTVLGGTLFFVMSYIRYQLWTSDGTAFGTVPVPVQVPGYLTNLVDAQGVLFFSAGDSQNSYGLWKSNGTLEGTMPVKRPIPAQGSATLGRFTPMRSTLFFTQQVDSQSVVLWRSNGDEALTMPVKSFRALSSGLTELNGMLFFVADEGGYKLWRSDGTEFGTASIKTGFNNPYNLTKANRSLFFGGYFEGHSELWKSDGTPTGTVLIRALECDPPSSFCRVNLGSMVGAGGRAFFVVQTTVGSDISTSVHIDYALWKSDGTAQGTVHIKTFGSIFAGSFGRNGTDTLETLTAADGRLFFMARETGQINYLWTSDGTPEGTLQLTAPSATITDAPANLTAAGARLFFTMNDRISGPELWESDGTPAGTRLVTDLFPGPRGSAPAGLAAIDGRLFFSANDGVHGRELWESDGTPEGTRLIQDIRPGPDGANPTQIAGINGSLVFSASDGRHGMEPWRSDGTPEGTELLQDIASGGANANPERFTFAGTHLFFMANDGVTGQELWALDSNRASIPMSGGTLAAWLDRTRYSFPAATFPVTATITHSLHDPAALPPAGALAATTHAFEVEAVDTLTGEPLTPAQPYAITIGYTAAERGVTIEGTLALYSWDGHQWSKEPSSRLDPASRQITATPDRFGVWAVLGETHRMLLPVVAR